MTIQRDNSETATIQSRPADGRARVSGHLQRNLGRLDIIFLTIAATISIDTIGQIASSGGGEAFTWTAVIVVAFLVPYGLVMAELGSSFPQEGGPYVWVRLAFGRFWASVSTMFYWITNPVWLGGSLTFLAATTWSVYLVHTHEGTAGDYLFKLAFIWLAILSAIVSLRYGKWLLNVGAILKVALVAVFVVTVTCAVLIYAWVLLGSWLSVFPGTIEPVLGITYDFGGTWGVSRFTFEAFTLGTLLAIVVFCTLGYWWARRHGDAGADFTANLQRELLAAGQA